MDHEWIFTLEDVISKGFEAHCVGPDGSRYLWHKAEGLRRESRIGLTTLVRDPTALPEGPWFPTKLGLEELAAAESPDPS